MEERIEKQHSICLTEVFNSREELEMHENECVVYKDEFTEIKKAMMKELLPVRGNFGTFCPHLQFVTLDALRPEDWPNHIAQNSIYLYFKIDLKSKTFEVAQCGHIWLSKHDQDKSYLAMCSMKKAHQHLGGKWLRKSKYKDANDLTAKVKKFYDSVMENMTKATGGYPYKQMLIDIY